MLTQIEGSRAVAEAVALCRPEVTVEGLSTPMTAGGRTYAATAGQGLLSMAEAIDDASGLGLPIVMTVANPAIGVRNDHVDSMSQRDSGWIQLYVESDQEALDVHIQAFKLAERLSLPVMVCMDGFIPARAFEPVDVPDQAQVDAFLPPFEPRQGATAGPEAFTGIRYLLHARQMQALDAIPEIAAEFEARFGRASGGLVRGHRTEDADTVVVALGSVVRTLEDVVDELREQGEAVGALAIRCFRPWPVEEVRAALGHAKRVIVVETALAVGVGGIVGQNVRLALDGLGVRVHDVIAGLGGRAITAASLRAMLEQGSADRLGTLTFL